MKIKDYVITKNAAQCLKCGDIVESKYRHHFAECKCGSMFVDGGKDYCRWGGDPIHVKNLSEYKEVIRELTLDWEKEHYRKYRPEQIVEE